MTPDFEIKFIVDRITPSLSILLTDTSTGVTNIAGNFKITFPDGSLYENLDFLDPDISVVGGEKSITALTNSSDGEVMRGAYTFIYTALDQDTDDLIGSTKSFSFSFDEPEVLITNTSDVALPKVAFSVATDFTQTDFTEVVETFEIESDFPATSAIDEQSLTETLTGIDRELDHVFEGSYYEGEYNPVVTYTGVFSHSALSYLTVEFSETKTSEFLINAAQTSQEVLALIANFKNNESGNIEQYNRAMALYSNIEAGAREGVADPGNSLLSELYELIGVLEDNDFQSGPIAGFIVSSQDLANYYNKSQVNALLAAFEATLQENVTVSVNGGGIGGFAFNETVSLGTPLSNMWVQLLRKAVAAIYDVATLVIGGSNLATGNLVGEVGLNETVTITPTFTQNDAGAISGFTLKRNSSNIEIDTTPPIPNATYTNDISANGNYAFSSVASHEQGPILNDSLGNPYPSGRISAGSVTSNTVTYKKVYPWYFGTGSAQPSTSADILAGTKEIEEIGGSISAAFDNISAEYLWFAVPSAFNSPKTYTEWVDEADVNNASEIGGASNLFGDPIVVAVTTTGLDSNYTINYDLYITNYKTLAFTAELS